MTGSHQTSAPSAMTEESGITPAQATGARRWSFKILQDELEAVEQQNTGALSKRIEPTESLQNDVSLGSSLPAEILLEIFAYVAYEGPGTSPESCGLIKVTHVCSRWREMALDCPKLWTRPSFCSEECTAEWIKRAKAAPLHFDIELGETSLLEGNLLEPPSPCNVDSIIKNLPLAQSIVIRDDFPMEPLLRIFLLMIPTNEVTGLVDLAILSPNAGSDSHFLSHLNRLAGPQLRYLRLEGRTLFIDMPLHSMSNFPSLTKLEVVLPDNVGWSLQQSRVEKVISCLRGLPQLRILMLKNAFRQDDRPIPSNLKYNGRFPALEQMVVKDQVSLLQKFFNQIPSLPKQVMAISCCFNGDDKCLMQDYEVLLVALRGLLKGNFHNLIVSAIPSDDGIIAKVSRQSQSLSCGDHVGLSTSIKVPSSPLDTTTLLNRMVDLLS